MNGLLSKALIGNGLLDVATALDPSTTSFTLLTTSGGAFQEYIASGSGDAATKAIIVQAVMKSFLGLGLVRAYAGLNFKSRGLRLAAVLTYIGELTLVAHLMKNNVMAGPGVAPFVIGPIAMIVGLVGLNASETGGDENKKKKN